VEDEKGEKNISECYLKIQVGNEGGWGFQCSSLWPSAFKGPCHCLLMKWREPSSRRRGLALQSLFGNKSDFKSDAATCRSLPQATCMSLVMSGPCVVTHYSWTLALTISVQLYSSWQPWPPHCQSFDNSQASSPWTHQQHFSQLAISSCYLTPRVFPLDTSVMLQRLHSVAVSFPGFF
jgi:hypothetical protein